jgi:2'-5' RNA ligase
VRESAEGRYVVVALFDPLPAGATMQRSQWPAHVTLAPDFVTSASRADVADAVAGAIAPLEPIPVRFMGEALFGPDEDLRVRLLVRTAQISGLHRRLADALAGLPGFAADEPAHWGSRHRPHLTLGAAVPPELAEPLTASCVAVARLTRNRARIVATFAASGGLAATAG